jgi:formiminoglutamase
MTLPLLISVPHAGLRVPATLQTDCLLTEEQIREDGDRYAGEIFTPLQKEVTAYVTTDIARAVLDINRAENDLSKDGVVKTHTCWDEPVWRKPLDTTTVEWLLENHHRPYHRQLSRLAKQPEPILALDCHTMVAIGPPVGPDPGKKRPQACLGNIDGESCPNEWLLFLQSALQKFFPGEVTLNQPFSGGYITRHHGREMPWIQLELSRGDFATPDQKSRWIRDALAEALHRIMQS